MANSPHPVPRIFVSHSHADNDFVEQIARDLRDLLGDYDAVWYDASGLQVGDAWWTKIVQELTARDVFILIISPEAMVSEWVRREFNIALLESKRIVPLLHRLDKRIWPDLRALHYISFLPPKSYETAFNQLLKALGINRPENPETHPPGTTLLTYPGHTKWVYTLAWSPDGNKIASGGNDKTVHVWNAFTGNRLVTYAGHSQRINSIAWAPDGSRIASASKDKTVHVWDAGTGALHYRYRNHAAGVNAIAWSSDNKFISSASSDRTIHTWNAHSGGQRFRLRGHVDEVKAIAWSPDRKHIASGSEDKTVRIWDAATGKEVFPPYEKHAQKVTAVLWSANNKYVASASMDSKVRIWEACSGRDVLVYDQHAHGILAIASLPGDNRIASTSYKAVHVWDAATGNHLFTYHEHADWVRAVAWSPDGKRIASAGDDNTVRVWNVA